jgi:hypothetical protein
MEVGLHTHRHSSSTLEGDEWSALSSGRFTSGAGAPGTHWIGNWMGPRARLDAVEGTHFLSEAELESQSPSP